MSDYRGVIAGILFKVVSRGLYSLRFVRNKWSNEACMHTVRLLLTIHIRREGIKFVEYCGDGLLVLQAVDKKEYIENR